MIARWFQHSIIIAIVGAAWALSPAPAAHTGGAAHYGVGRMEHVADVRGMPHTPCMASSPYYPLRTRLRVTRLATGRTELCETFDESAPPDRAGQIRRGIVIELGWPAAKRLCGLRYVGQEPPWKCRVKVEEL
jgi:hypothetical protein